MSNNISSIKMLSILLSWLFCHILTSLKFKMWRPRLFSFLYTHLPSSILWELPEFIYVIVWNYLWFFLSLLLLYFSFRQIVSFHHLQSSRFSFFSLTRVKTLMTFAWRLVGVEPSVGGAEEENSDVLIWCYLRKMS